VCIDYLVCIDDCVCVIGQAPAVDVVAVGLSSGCVVVHNIRYDEKLMSFTQDWGPVTAISFRTGKYNFYKLNISPVYALLFSLQC